MKQLSTNQQAIIDQLVAGQRLLAVEHSAVGVFGGKLYNASLSSKLQEVHNSTLKALIARGLLTEIKRDPWQSGEGWKLEKLEYQLAKQEGSRA